MGSFLPYSMDPDRKNMCTSGFANSPNVIRSAYRLGGLDVTNGSSLPYIQRFDGRRRNRDLR